jgi:hypothetical protein
VGRNEIGRLIEGLEASFEVAQLQEDDFVADDLAHVLRQGRALADVLSSGPWRVTAGDQTIDVEVVADDHVRCSSGRLLIPLQRGVFTRGRGPAPIRSTSTWRRALNALARQGSPVQAEVEGRLLAGLVAAVGSDYLELKTHAGRTLVPFDGVKWLRLSRGGSADAS